MSTLYLIRHGQASFGADNYDKLSKNGFKQSEITADYFINAGIFFDLVYTGTMVRHDETASEYFKALKLKGRKQPEIIRAEELNEYDSASIVPSIMPELIEDDPSWQEHLDRIFDVPRSFQLLFQEIIGRWITGRYKDKSLGTWQQFMDRITKIINDILSQHGRDKTIACFTSGGTIAAFVQKALNLPDTDALRLTWQIVNASVSRFKCTDENLMLWTFNEYSHLERSGEGGLVTYR